MRLSAPFCKNNNQDAVPRIYRSYSAANGFWSVLHLHCVQTFLVNERKELARACIDTAAVSEHTSALRQQYAFWRNNFLDAVSQAHSSYSIAFCKDNSAPSKDSDSSFNEFEESARACIYM